MQQFLGWILLPNLFFSAVVLEKAIIFAGIVIHLLAGGLALLECLAALALEDAHHGLSLLLRGSAFLCLVRLVPHTRLDSFVECFAVVELGFLLVLNITSRCSVAPSTFLDSSVPSSVVLALTGKLDTQLTSPAYHCPA